MKYDKLCGTVLLLESVLTISLFIIIFSGGILLGGHIVTNFKTDKMISESTTIDRALEMYSMAHQSIKTDTIKISDITGIQYSKNKVYPQNLTELGIIQDKFGYFTTNVDLSKFNYSVIVQNNGFMTYELGVTLPNGKYYKSLGSDK